MCSMSNRLNLAPSIDQMGVQGRKVSKSSSRVGAVEESNSSGACDFTGENTFRCGILYFPVYCVKPCIASYVIRMLVAKLGLAPPCLLWAWLCSMGETVSSVKPFCETFCETWPSVRPWFPWGLAFCETLASVRRCLLWDPSFSETLPLFIMLDPLWDLAFFEALPSVRPCLLWGPAFCGS